MKITYIWKDRGEYIVKDSELICFIKKYLINNEFFLSDIKDISIIKKFSPGDILDIVNYIYYINSGSIDCKKVLKNQNISNYERILNFYNKGKDKLFFDYSFCFISNYFMSSSNKDIYQEFVVAEKSELMLFEYSELKLLIEKYNILEKFTEILDEFEKNRIKKEIYKILLEL